MLVLSRKRGESIIIADGLITVTVLEIHGRQVRLGIEAPRDISVVREELVGEQPRPRLEFAAVW